MKTIIEFTPKVVNGQVIYSATTPSITNDKALDEAYARQVALQHKAAEKPSTANVVAKVSLKILSRTAQKTWHIAKRVGNYALDFALDQLAASQKRGRQRYDTSVPILRNSSIRRDSEVNVTVNVTTDNTTNVNVNVNIK